MTPFMLFLRPHLDRLRPLLRERVDMRIALHAIPGVQAWWRPPRIFCARSRASSWST